MSTDFALILRRVEKRLKDLGLSASAASKAAGKPDAIRNLQRAVANDARSGISTATIKALARALATSPEWLLNGEEATPPPTDAPVAIKRVKVIGMTQAGVWTEIESFEDEAVSEEVPVVPGKWSHLPQFAYKVRGASMENDRFFDGDYCICVNYFDARKDIENGDRVVVERMRGGAIERTIKIIEAKGRTISLVPRSNNPRFQPIVIKRNNGYQEEDGTEVRLIGLVIGRWSPL